jgi:hypothetical protein
MRHRVREWLLDVGDRTISERVANDLEYPGIVDRAAEFFHPQTGGIRDRVFQRIECGWGPNGRRLEGGEIPGTGRFDGCPGFPTVWSGRPGNPRLPG